MKIVFPLFALSVLLSGCVAHHLPHSQSNQPIAPQFAEPLLLRDFSQQMDSTRQQAAAGARSAQQQYGGWLASAGQRDNAQPLLTAAAYSRGIGVKKNPALAVDWYRKAAEQGNAQARQLAQQFTQQYVKPHEDVLS